LIDKILVLNLLQRLFIAKIVDITHASERKGVSFKAELMALRNLITDNIGDMYIASFNKNITKCMGGEQTHIYVLQIFLIQSTRISRDLRSKGSFLRII
jgi:hypothetical protein